MFGKKKGTPEEVRIAGIYRASDRLGLGKTYRRESDGREFLVAMTSGRDAVYRYADSERAGTCDWDWHILRFTRYAAPADADLTRFR